MIAYKPQFIKEQPDLVESFFMKGNYKKKAIWLKFTFFKSKKNKQNNARIWITFFEKNKSPILFKETYNIQKAKFSNEILIINKSYWDFKNQIILGSIDNCSFKVQYEILEEPFSHLPSKIFYSDLIPTMKILTISPSLKLKASFIYNNKKFNIKNGYGMIGHNWGTKHSFFYAWGHCNIFEKETPHTFFEGFSTRIRIRKSLLPFVSLGVLSIDGERILWNSFKEMLSSKVEIDTKNYSWYLYISGKKFDLELKMQDNPIHFIELEYWNPSGILSKCKNSKIANIEIKLINSSNKKTLKILKSQYSALEILETPKVI